MKEKTCCFIGHPWLPKDRMKAIVLRLDEEIENLIHDGVITFLSGGKMGFDKMAAALIADRKSRGYDIRLVMALPYPGHDSSWPEGERIHHQLLLSKADEVIYLSDTCDESYSEKCDQFLFEQSAYCICALFNREECLSETPVSCENMHVINVTR